MGVGLPAQPGLRTVHRASGTLCGERERVGDAPVQDEDKDKQ